LREEERGWREWEKTEGEREEDGEREEGMRGRRGRDEGERENREEGRKEGGKEGGGQLTSLIITIGDHISSGIGASCRLPICGTFCVPGAIVGSCV